MKKRLLCAMMALSLLIVPAFAANWEDFTESHDHWAAETLRRAVEDGILSGDDTGSLNPDGALTVAEMVTVLTRALDATEVREGAEIDEDVWYGQAVEKAYALGIIEPMEVTGAVTREMAFTAFANAFQLISAEPDYSVLGEFSDSGSLSGQSRAAAAELVSLGLVQGSYGKLEPQRKLSRAEFVTMLYRIADTYIPDSSISDIDSKGVILTDERVTLQGAESDGTVVFDTGVKSVTLNSVELGGTTVIRSDRLESLNIGSYSNISRLVLANMQGNLSIYAGYSSGIDSLVVGFGEGQVTVSGGVERVDVTGSGRKVVISGSGVAKLNISGSDCEVIVSSKIDSINITGRNNTVTVNAGKTETVNLDGSGNHLTVNAQAGQARLSGAGNVLDGTGSAEKAIITTPDYSLSLRCDNIPQNAEPFDGISAAVVVPSYLEEGQAPVEVHAVFSVTGAPLSCDYEWFIDGVSVETGNGLFVCDGAEVKTSFSPEYTQDMKLEREVVLRLSYVNQNEEDTEEHVFEASAVITLNNYSDDYYNRLSPEKVLALVSSEYAGDYTLQWAQEHDYDSDVKEAWVNAKGYTSSTDYLIWINRAYQRVNIFQGSSGKWELIRSSIVGTGAAYSQTPLGATYVTYKSSYGWLTDTYLVRPVVGFYPGTGYAFHSRLYTPSGVGWSDSRIGFPVSHGCIRMYDEDIQWIYDNIPLNTKVVIF